MKLPFIKCDNLVQLAEAWDAGHDAGFEDGSKAEFRTCEQSLGYQVEPLPEKAQNPYR
jgi:hypothetical protein